MQKTTLRTIALSTLAVLATAAIANTQGDQLLKQINDLKSPAFDQTKQSDQAYRTQYQAEVKQYVAQRNALIEDLYKSDPANPKLAKLLMGRWISMGKDAEPEIDKVLADHPSKEIQTSADYAKFSLFMSTRPHPDQPAWQSELKSRADAFVQAHPESDLAQTALLRAGYSESEPIKLELFKELVAKYPDSKMVPMIKGVIARGGMLGKPIHLAFKDAVTGAPVDIAGLKGKVVLIDFWATWCGPCVAEMPDVKKMYATYHSKGVEILGVSLDNPESDGGLTKLKDFVAKNEIPWPMYYQGKGWDSEFSASMGIMSIPDMFIIDKDGNFQGQVDVRSSDFETKLNKFLSK